MQKEVAKNNAGALQTISLRADSGRGTEELRSDDVSTPILKILHQLSPECNSRNAKYVKGAQPGMIYSVVAHTQTRYPEWQERGDSAAAPVGVHMNIPADATEEKNGRYRLPNGNYVEKTMYFYVVSINNSEMRKAVISMRSSNLTPGRELNNLISNLRMTDDKGTFQPAAYSAIFNLKTVGKNWGDKSWHVYKPSLVRMLDVSDAKDADIYTAAQSLQQEVSKGATKPSYEKVENTKQKEII